MNKMKEGWAKILNLESKRTTKKHHYFREGMALCGKYMLEGGDGFLVPGDGYLGQEDCKKCSELFEEDHSVA